MSLGNWDGLGPQAGTNGPDRADSHNLAPDAHLEDNPLGDESADDLDADTASDTPSGTDDGGVR